MQKRSKAMLSDQLYYIVAFNIFMQNLDVVAQCTHLIILKKTEGSIAGSEDPQGSWLGLRVSLGKRRN